MARMPTTLPPKRRPHAANWSGGPSWLSLGLTIPMAIGVLAATVPMPLVLPLLAVLCVASALVLAALTFVLRRVTGQVAEDDFDVPGVLCLLGFAACIVADAPEALRHLADLGTHAVVEAGLTPMPDKSN